MMAGAHPDFPGPPKYIEVAGTGWRSFWWSNLSMTMGKEQLWETHSEGPGLMAVSFLLLNQAPKWQFEVGRVNITCRNRVLVFFWNYKLNNFHWGHSKDQSLGCTLNIQHCSACTNFEVEMNHCCTEENYVCQVIHTLKTILQICILSIPPIALLSPTLHSINPRLPGCLQYMQNTWWSAQF